MTRHRFVLEGVHRTVVVYGYDLAGLGFFLSVVVGRKRIVEYDSLHPGYDGLPGLICALEVAGVASTNVVHAALNELVEGHVLDGHEVAVRAVAEMVTILRREAGQ